MCSPQCGVAVITFALNARDRGSSPRWRTIFSPYAFTRLLVFKIIAALPFKKSVVYPIHQSPRLDLFVFPVTCLIRRVDS